MAQHSSATQAQGDGITVRVGAIGGTVQELILAVGATVRDALRAAEYDEESEVRCNGDVYRNGDPVDNGDLLIVASATKVTGHR